MVDAVEQSLLLPEDMANLKFMRHYEVFLRLKRDLVMVNLLLLFIYLFLLLFFVFFNLCSLFFSGRPGHLQGQGDGDQLLPRMKEEEGRRITVVDAFHVAEKSNKDLKAKLAEEEKERKYAAAALENVEKQAES